MHQTIAEKTHNANYGLIHAAQLGKKFINIILESLSEINVD